jgi:type IV pilus assembly protein PilM
MIKNIFLPEKIGGYYLFAKRVVGIDIGKTHINATQLYISGHSTTIEKNIEEPLDTAITTDNNERIVTALKKVISQLDSFDELRTSLSSSLVIFKELRLPFLAHEKIKMVIDFEVEPQLPFAIDNAVIDFIITKQVADQKSSEVLVAAAQKQHIAEHLRLFEQAGVSPNAVSVDLFEVYGLYKKIPEYAQLTGSVALIDIGLQSTRVAHIYNGQLRSIRTIGKGVSNIVKAASEHTNTSTSQFMEYFVRFGLDKTEKADYVQATEQAFLHFWQEVNFTLTSFAAHTLDNKAVSTIMLLGGGANIKGVAPFVANLGQTPCKLFRTQELIKNKTIRVKAQASIDQASIISLCTALPSPTTEQFSLLRGEFSAADTAPLIKQLIIGVVLSITALSCLIGYTVMEIGQLAKEAHESEREAVEMLKDRFKKIPNEEDDLDDVVSIAEQEVQKEEKTWFAFSSQARASFLKYLLELTNKIDKESLGFSVDSIAISSGVLTLKAQVKDHEALKIFERELRQSKLFSYVEPQADPVFTMKIILAQNGEDS